MSFCGEYPIALSVLGNVVGARKARVNKTDLIPVFMKFAVQSITK